MNKLKHSKFRNTGILFELLVRQITADILNNKTSKANYVLKKYFDEKTLLGKELQLYNSILKEKCKDKETAEKFLEHVLHIRSKLNNKSLLQEKYELVKEIKECFPINEFFRSNISNYKTFASIYKIFEEKCNPNSYIDPKELFSSRNHIIENIAISKNVITENKEDILDYYEKQEKEVRLFSFKLLIDSFNEKYKELNLEQKNLLKEYINNISNTNCFKEYLNKKISDITNKLNSFKINDKVLNIKLKETINQLNEIKKIKTAKDTHVTAVLKCYELIEEFKKCKKI
jgi:hypothetical protein